MRSWRPWNHYPAGHHEVERKARWVTVYASTALGNMNLPGLWVDWADSNEVGLSLGWGNGNSDPVWEVGASVRLPRWAMRSLELAGAASRWWRRT